MNTDISLELLGSLAEAVASASTETGVLRNALAVMRTAWSVPWLEWRQEGGGLRAEGEPVHASELGLEGRSSFSSLSEAALVVDVRHAPQETRRTQEVQQARRSGADLLCVLPLAEHGTWAFALKTRRGVAHPNVAVLDAARRIVVAGIGSMRALRRAGTVARHAHETSALLRTELANATLPEGVVAASPAMRRILLEEAPLVAPYDTTVLITGETGTGKEVVARRIQSLSRRAHRPFLRVNCGAVPESLVESALFGHERGAFTGAVARHRGFFERAHGGTLFLDEIAELPMSTQAKLLRVLQEGELERVGGEEPVSVDVRLITATHANLEERVQRRRFRRDLFYRLNVFAIALPPLRTRAEDIAPLAAAILARLAKRAGRPAPKLTADIAEQLRASKWPGNVRELENVLERAFIVTPPGGRLVLSSESAAPLQGAERVRARRMRSFDEEVADVIRVALKQTSGKIYGPSGAAALLRLKPTTLQSKMKRLRVRSP